MLKISKPGFSNIWTVNFQTFKLVLEKVEEPEIKLPTSAGLLKQQESSRKTSAAPAAAKSHQSCPTLWDPIDGSPPGSTIPGILQARTLQRKTSTSALLTMPKPLTVWIITHCGKFWKRWEYQTTWPASWEICRQVRKPHLDVDMEQQAGSK